MKREEFKKVILSIGFIKIIGVIYRYKDYSIHFFGDTYHFFNGLECIGLHNYNDLTPFKVFKKELRSIKLKQLLG